MFFGYMLESTGQSLTLLQFVDDTLIIGDKTHQNVCSTKALLQLFEVLSCLSVNFHKSKLFGVHVQEHKITQATCFLHFKVEVIPFVVVGVLIGSYYKLSTW